MQYGRSSGSQQIAKYCMNNWETAYQSLENNFRSHNAGELVLQGNSSIYAM